MAIPQRTRLHGIALVILGALFLIFNLSNLSLRDLWPVIFIALGLYFVVLFAIDRKDYGVLMPASIFLVMGAMFQYCQIEGWWMMRVLWPLFLVGPGLGFFLLYYFGKRESGLLIPGYILTGLGVLFILIESEGWYLWPILLIVAGAIMLLRRRSDPTPPPTAGL